MRIPTIDQFNKWSFQDKCWFVDYETGGRYKEMNAEDGFPIIVYPKENVAIVFKVDRKGVLTEAEAMELTEAKSKLVQFDAAWKAMSTYN